MLKRPSNRRGLEGSSMSRRLSSRGLEDHLSLLCEHNDHQARESGCWEVGEHIEGAGGAFEMEKHVGLGRWTKRRAVQNRNSRTGR